MKTKNLTKIFIGIALSIATISAIAGTTKQDFTITIDNETSYPIVYFMSTATQKNNAQYVFSPAATAVILPGQPPVDVTLGFAPNQTSLGGALTLSVGIGLASNQGTEVTNQICRTGGDLISTRDQFGKYEIIYAFSDGTIASNQPKTYSQFPLRCTAKIDENEAMPIYPVHMEIKVLPWKE